MRLSGVAKEASKPPRSRWAARRRIVTPLPPSGAPGAAGRTGATRTALLRVVRAPSGGQRRDKVPAAAPSSSVVAQPPSCPGGRATRKPAKTASISGQKLWR